MKLPAVVVKAIVDAYILNGNNWDWVLAWTNSEFDELAYTFRIRLSCGAQQTTIDSLLFVRLDSPT